MAKRISKIRELLREDAELKKVDEKDVEKLEAELEKELKAEAADKMPEDSDKEEVTEDDSEEEEKKEKEEVKEEDKEEEMIDGEEEVKEADLEAAAKEEPALDDMAVAPEVDDLEKEFDINDASDIFLDDDEEVAAIENKEKEDGEEELEEKEEDSEEEKKEKEEVKEEDKEEEMIDGEEEKEEKEEVVEAASEAQLVSKLKKLTHDSWDVEEDEYNATSGANKPSLIGNTGPKADAKWDALVQKERKIDDEIRQTKKELVKLVGAAKAKKLMQFKEEKIESKPTMNIEEHMTALFNGETLTEDFQKKARTIFEAAVREKVVQYATTLKQRYNNRLVAAKAKIEEKLVAKVDSYMDYVVEEWMEQNKLSVEHGLRTEITEEFLTDLRNLFETHNIMIPKGKENLVESLSSKVEKLEKEVNDQTKKTMTLHKKLNEYKKTETFRQICEGLADTEIEKLKSLASSLEYDESYKEKLTVIKENYFSQKAKKADPIEEVAEKKPEVEKKLEFVDENMASYLNVIKKIRQ